MTGTEPELKETSYKKKVGGREIKRESPKKHEVVSN